MCSCNDDFAVDSNGCFDCDPVCKVKGRFGLAWISESPDCPCPEPIGWQVEFLDTPSKVEQKCQEMVHWINCPPLPRCDPCPPNELCCSSNPPKCNPCAPRCNPCVPKCDLPKCTCGKKKKPKKCCCCCKPKRCCYPPVGGPCCGKRSPPRCSCDDGQNNDTNS